MEEPSSSEVSLSPAILLQPGVQSPIPAPPAMPSPALPRCVSAAPPHHHHLEPVLLLGACLPQKLCPLAGLVAGCCQHYCRCHCRCHCHPSSCHLEGKGVGKRGIKFSPGKLPWGNTLAETRPQYGGSRWDWRPQALCPVHCPPHTLLWAPGQGPLEADLGWPSAPQQSVPSGPARHRCWT